MTSYLKRNFGILKHIITENEIGGWRMEERVIYGNGSMREISVEDNWGEESFLLTSMDLEDAYLFFNITHFLEKSNQAGQYREQDEYYLYHSTLDKASDQELIFTIDFEGSTIVIKKVGSFLSVNFYYEGGC